MIASPKSHTPSLPSVHTHIHTRSRLTLSVTSHLWSSEPKRLVEGSPFKDLLSEPLSLQSTGSHGHMMSPHFI